MKIIKVCSIALVSLLLLATMVGYFFFKSTIPVTAGVLWTAGIEQPLAIARNSHGVPFIKAAGDDDLFFAIGFVHAQDRLFQMDCMRRAAVGRLSEIFGPRTLSYDIRQHYLQAGAGIEKSFRALKRDAKKTLECYCRGVNFFLDSQPLPPEFHLLNYEPEPWQIRDVLAVLKYLECELAYSGNELQHVRLLAALAPEQARQWLAKPWPAADSASCSWPRHFQGPLLSRLLAAESDGGMGLGRGSAWVVSGKRTVSGRPFLANDFSWLPTMPALFYLLGGKTPDWEISGNTVPGVPFIFSGRSRQLGWGITTAAVDTLDYFYLSSRPGHGGSYLCDGEWFEFQVRERRIRCRGGADYVLKIKLSKFGPVIEEAGCLLAVQSLVANRSTAVEALWRMQQASNPKEFVLALRKLSAPALQVFFADRKGNIGACAPGLHPLRGKGNGLLPVRAASLQDRWQGLAAAEQESILNPEKGWLSMADMTSPGNHPNQLFSFEPLPDFRAERLADLLAGKDKFDLEAMMRIQNDTQAKNAQFLIEKIKNLPVSSAGAKTVQNALTAWSGSIGEGIEPVFFYRFERHLARAVFAPNWLDEKAAPEIPPAWLYPLLEYPRLGGNFFPQVTTWTGRTTRADIFARQVEDSLEATYQEFLRESQGNSEAWHWENLHTVHFNHPLGNFFVLKPFFERGSTSARGGRYCLLHSDFTGGSGFKTSLVAAYKMIIDFSDFSKSWRAAPTGQSGHPLSAAYDDQMSMFAALKYLPLDNLGGQLVTLRLLPVAKKKVK